MKKKQEPRWGVKVFTNRKDKGEGKILFREYTTQEYKEPRNDELVIREVTPLNRLARRISASKEKRK